MTQTPRSFRYPRAFTLVELILSSALLTVLLLAGAATASLVRRAGMSQIGDSSVALSQAMQDLRRDIECATSVGPISSRGISLTVPDRTGDGNSDTIAYAWSGSIGAPLTRSINGGGPATLVPSVLNLAIEWDTTFVSVASADQVITPPSQTVASCITSSSLNTIQCNSRRWIAVAFPPSLPVGTTSWSLSSVRLSLRRNGTADSTFAVQVRSTNAMVPTSTVLASVTVNESSLGTSFAYYDYAITGLSGLSPTAPLAIVLQPISGTNVAEWQFTAGGGSVNASDATYQSSTSGASWSVLSSQEPLFSVTGTPSASAPAKVATEVVRVVRVSAEGVRGVTVAFEAEARGFGSATGSAVATDTSAR